MVSGFVRRDSDATVLAQLGGARVRSAHAVARCCHSAAAWCRRGPVRRSSVDGASGEHETNA